MDHRRNLQDLPVEVLFAIFDLLSPLTPAKVPHPFLALSITSLTLRSALISFLRHRILTSPAVTTPGNKRLRTALADQTRDISQHAPVILRTWLRATMNNCFACGKPTRRRAIMEPTTVCCPGCDYDHWPDKITMTEAIRKYDLKRVDLFDGVLPANLGGGPPEEAVLLTKDGLGLLLTPRRRGLLYGQKSVCGVLTTLFMEEHVRELARQKHGLVDMDEYLQSIQDRRATRQARVDVNREKRIDYVRRLIQTNGFTAVLGLERYRDFISNYDGKPLYHCRSKQVLFDFLRGDLILKKLGITFSQVSYHLWEFPRRSWEYLPLLDGSSSKCISMITSLQEAGFTQGKTLLLGIGDCYFQRKTSTTHQMEEFPGQRPPVHNIEHLIFRRLRWGSKSQEWADPIDFCLFEAFIQEFGVQGVSRPTLSYAQLREIWREKMVDINDGIGNTLFKSFNAPWSWLRYPLFIKDVPEENYSQAITPGQAHNSNSTTLQTPPPLPEKEQQKWDKKRKRAELTTHHKNHEREQEFEELVKAIRTVVRTCGWDLLAKDGGDSWDKAVKDVLAGVEIENTMVPEGQKQKEKEKEKEKEKGKEMKEEGVRWEVKSDYEVEGDDYDDAEDRKMWLRILSGQSLEPESSGSGVGTGRRE